MDQGESAPLDFDPSYQPSQVHQGHVLSFLTGYPQKRRKNIVFLALGPLPWTSLGFTGASQGPSWGHAPLFAFSQRSQTPPGVSWDPRETSVRLIFGDINSSTHHTSPAGSTRGMFLRFSGVPPKNGERTLFFLPWEGSRIPSPGLPSDSQGLPKGSAGGMLLCRGPLGSPGD
jgi:hypothetical protein